MAAGRADLAVLFMAYFLLGTIETLFDKAALALLPFIIEDDGLEEANGRLFATSTVANELVGPPLGSTLFSLFPPAAFFLSAVAFVISSRLIQAIPGAFVASSALGGRPWDDIRIGVRWF